MNLSDIIMTRLRLISIFEKTFVEQFEPSLQLRFRRGPIQRLILNHLNMRPNILYLQLINEAIEKNGYKKIIVEGKVHFKRIK